MATISFCSSSLTASISHKHVPTVSLSKGSLGFRSLTPSLSSHRITTTPFSSRPLSLLFVPKFSEAEAPVLEAEPEISVAQPSEVTEIQGEEPKREEIFAVVMIGGRQYIVFPGRYIYTQRLKGANVNDKIVLNKVLLVGTKTSTYLGLPVVPSAVVHAVVEEQGLNKKVVVFKYKKKKGYRRNIGHRQPNTRIRIIGITGYQNSPAVELT